MPTHIGEYDSFKEVARCLKGIKILVKAHGLLNSQVECDQIEQRVFKKYARGYNYIYENGQWIRPSKTIEVEKFRIVWSFDVDPKRKPIGKLIRGLGLK